MTPSFNLALMFCFGLFLSASSTAQSTFNRSYAMDSLKTVSMSILPAEDGYYLSGFSLFNQPELFISKLNLDGDVVWTQFHSGPHNPLYAIEDNLQYTPEGNIVTTGWTWDEEGVIQGFLYWFNQEGDSIRSKLMYSPFAFDEPEGNSIPSIYNALCLTQDEAGNLFHVADLTYPYSLTRKFDQQGNIVWTQLNTHEEATFAHELLEIVYHEGLLYHVYLNLIWPEGANQYLVISDPDTGEFIATILLPSLNARIYDLEIEPDGYIFATLMNHPDAFGSAAAVVKTDLNGNLLWTIQHGDPDGGFSNAFERIEPTSDGNYVAVGVDKNNNPENEELEGLYDYGGMLLKFNSEGEELWLRRYRLVESIYDRHLPDDLRPTPDGGFIFCGEVRDGDTNNPNFEFPGQRAWVVKVDQFGCLEPGCQFTDVHEISIGLENSMSIAPNPVENYCSISISLPEGIPVPQNTRLEIYDLQGKRVLELQLFNLEEDIEIDTRELPSGVYIVHWLGDDTWLDSVSMVRQ
jgi:hypothetical protein